MNTNFLDRIVRISVILAFAFGVSGISTSSVEAQGDPFFTVRVNEGKVLGYNWTNGIPITLTIDDPATPQPVDFTKTQTNPPEYLPRNDFDLDGYVVKPGDIVTLTDGTISEVHTVLDFTLTNVDPETNTLFGTGEPATFVHIHMNCDATGCAASNNDIIVDQSGSWFADFTGIFDIKTGTKGEAYQIGADGNSTSFSWEFPNPTISVNPDGVWGIDWALGASVTLTVNDPANGAGIDYTATEIVEMYNFPNPTAVFHLPSYLQIQPGFELTMTDGSIIKTYTVMYLKIMNIDVNNDTVSGLADPGEEVWVWMDGGERTVITDQNGSWSADLRIPGGLPGEETTFDILPNTFVMAFVKDEDGDGTTDWGEAMKPPLFMLNINNDSSWHEVTAWNWQLGSAVTLTVDDPGTFQNPDYTETQIMGLRSGGYPTGASYLQNNELEGHPGFTITLSDGIQTKTMIVPLLQGTEYNVEEDTVSGITNPFARVVVACDVGAEPTVIADSEGKWTANFRDPENPEVVLYDVRPGTWCEPQMYDNDRDHIVLRDWQVSPGEPPQCQPGDTVTGTVFEHDGITPVPFTNIQIDDFNTGEIRFTSTADQNGTFACYLPEGDYRILAWTENFTHTQEY